MLGGGNALGAYHAGLYEALHEAELEPDWVVGTSIGAITGAIIAGNEPARRLDQLRRFWRPAGERSGWPMPWDLIPDEWRRTSAVLQTMLGGQPGLFGPIGSPGAWPLRDRHRASPGLYDTRMLIDTLAALIDFERLNEGDVRFTAVAVDIETGEEILIDSATRTLTPEHLRASAALLTAYPAVEVDGRILGDGGISMNLPIDPVMAAEDGISTLCVASDLLPLSGPRPHTLGEVAGRLQDLIFAAQSLRSLRHWQAIFDGRGDQAPSVTLVTAAYSSQAREVAGKVMDFSPESIRARWGAGHADGTRLAKRIVNGEVAVGQPGLKIYPAEHG